ncbi:DUF1016 N-terminal domain-containing protein [Niabella hibiscisoli]|uniref:DUF1016 N-terminal domain-containing protein n=1 Tax=Niabella hibiscisoli TaxID=1825928 RepID=UPI001F104C75|nr:DUF1016 N-terminal domain-containing protein [Niabella hibiscisoli]MCH5715394.1 DUF1016 N-terminal domain-containing protein [Niabella hibiscisoli]
MNSKPGITSLFSGIKNLVQQSKEELYRIINTTLVETYYHIGRLIVEFEQQGSTRAGYASGVLKTISLKLTKEFGKGFSVDNLENMRRFYNEYKRTYVEFLEAQVKSETVSRKLRKPQSSVSKSETLSRKSVFTLSWSHYLLLMKIGDLNERSFYTVEAYNESWSVRELQRQFDSALYERLVLSRNKKRVKELSKKVM